MAKLATGGSLTLAAKIVLTDRHSTDVGGTVSRHSQLYHLFPHVGWKVSRGVILVLYLSGAVQELAGSPATLTVLVVMAE